MFHVAPHPTTYYGALAAVGIALAVLLFTVPVGLVSQAALAGLNLVSVWSSPSWSRWRRCRPAAESVSRRIIWWSHRGHQMILLLQGPPGDVQRQSRPGRSGTRLDREVGGVDDPVGPEGVRFQDPHLVLDVVPEFRQPSEVSRSASGLDPSQDLGIEGLSTITWQAMEWSLQACRYALKGFGGWA